MVESGRPLPDVKENIENLILNNQHIQAADAVFNLLMDEYKFATMKDTGEIYVYNGCGIYKNDGEQIIHEQIARLYAQNSKINTYNEIKHRIKGESFLERNSFNGDINLIPVENGLLDLKTNTLTPHTHEKHFTFKINATYNPTATCPEIDKFISEVFHPADIPIAYEIIAYCLLRLVPIQKAIMLLGEGANGKSVYLKLISTFLGNDNVCNIPLHDLAENRFALTGLFGMLANVYPDLEESPLKTTGKIKAAISGDRLPYEKKHQDIGSFEPYAKHLFSTNKLPKTRDNSFAYFRRWCIIECSNKFSAELGNKDAEKINKITTPEELSGLLNKCLIVLPALLEKQDFSEGRTKSIELKWMRGSDSIKAFITECIVKDDAMTISKDLLYRVYQKYCELFECECETPQAFGRDFKTFITYANHILLEVKDEDGKKKKVKAIRGIKVVKPEFESDTVDTDFIHMLECEGTQYSSMYEISVSKVSENQKLNQSNIDIDVNNDIHYNINNKHLDVFNFIATSGQASLGDLLGEFQGFEVEAILKDLCDAGKINEFKHNVFEVVK